MDFNWHKGPHLLYISAESPDFDQETIRNWHDEGFKVVYLPFDIHKKKEYREQLHHLGDSLSMGEKWAIVGSLNSSLAFLRTRNYPANSEGVPAYGDAAAIVLDACAKPISKLCAVIAYYPTQYAKTSAGYPPNTEVMVHAAGSQKVPLKCRAYNYPGAELGFAEADLEAYDKVSASLAWSRTLGAVRKGFGINVDLEAIWENHLALEFSSKDVDATMATMVPEPHVNHIPTLTGGTGAGALRRFYADFFIPSNPPSLKIRLLSRTEGTDRIVDEMHVSFKHTQEIPWMLPGVKATGKDVQVILVSVVAVRGGKLRSEHIYWDQASLLVQLGLLDPGLVPEGMKGVCGRLPVVGVEGASGVVGEGEGEGVEMNGLMEGW